MKLMKMCLYYFCLFFPFLGRGGGGGERLILNSGLFPFQLNVVLYLDSNRTVSLDAENLLPLFFYPKLMEKLVPLLPGDLVPNFNSVILRFFKCLRKGTSSSCCKIYKQKKCITSGVSQKMT